MKFVFTEEDLTGKANYEDSETSNFMHRGIISNTNITYKTSSNKTGSSSNSLDRARFETNSALNKQSGFKEMQNEQYPYVSNIVDFDQYTSHEQPYNKPYMESKRFNNHSSITQKTLFNKQAENNFQQDMQFDILPLLNESSDSQQLNQQKLQRNKGFQQNKRVLGYDNQSQLSSIKSKAINASSQNNKNTISDMVPINKQSQESIQQRTVPLFNTQQIKSNEKNIMNKAESSQSITTISNNTNLIKGFNFKPSNNLVPFQLTFNNTNNCLQNNKPTNLSINQRSQKSQILNSYQQSNASMNSLQQNYPQLNTQQQRQGFVANLQLKQNPSKNLPIYQNNPQSTYQTNMTNRKQKEISEKQMLQRIQMKKQVALIERKKKGFLMTDKYKQKFQNKDQNKRIRNGFVFEGKEKLFQQILLIYHKKDLVDKCKKADGIDFTVLQKPNCIQPQPSTPVNKDIVTQLQLFDLQKVEDDKMYYGVLHSMRDKHFMDLLDFLQKGTMFSFEMLKKFEEKRMELLNNSLKRNLVLKPSKKKIGTSCFSNLGNKQNNGLGFNNTNQSFQNNNSLNAGQNSFNDFASESNSVHGMGWDNTNMSSDQFILNMINSLKNQQQPIPSCRPSQFEQMMSDQQSYSESPKNKYKSLAISNQKQISQECFENRSNTSPLNQRKENTEDQVFQVQKGTSNLDLQQPQSENNKQMIDGEQNPESKDKLNTIQKVAFTSVIADGIKKIGQILRQKIFSYKIKDQQQISSSSTTTSSSSSIIATQALPVQNQQNTIK